MKKFFILLGAIVLFAFNARVEPFDVFLIKSSVAGSVTAIKKEVEAKEYKGIIVKIDDKQEQIELKNLKTQAKFLKEEIKNQELIVKRKYDTYKRYEELKTKSLDEKNIKFYDYISAKNQLINLKTQLNNTLSSIEKLKDTINKKNIIVNGYINKILVNKGDYIAPGTPIVEVDDIKKQKLVIYVPIDEIENIKNKKIYINNKPSNFRVYKVWVVPDSKYITSYKVELIGSGLKLGEIVKVSFK
ncbi:hypothetical protein JCM11957_05730 [Caminibacter profundus]